MNREQQHAARNVVAHADDYVRRPSAVRFAALQASIDRWRATINDNVAHNRTGTSKAAAAAIAPKVGTVRFAVLTMLARNPGTSDQLENESGWPHTTVSSAVNWLANAGFITDTGRRAMTRNRREAIVWGVTDAGREAITMRRQALNQAEER